jgi:8-oxo-dGTP pyrophosphatase MutT (NUDIX family)
VYNGSQILLGLKKRGFGAGRWNGFGGKTNEGETPASAARRELEEEAEIVPEDLKERGRLVFTFENNDDELEVHLFSVEKFSGEPKETEEMKPQWFNYSEIPYNEMWADDPHWLPLILSGKNVSGKVHFDAPDTQTILTKSIIEIDA